MASHQLGTRLTDVAVLDAVAAGRSAPVERFDRFRRLRRRKPVSGLDTAGQPGGTALHRPRPVSYTHLTLPTTPYV